MPTPPTFDQPSYVIADGSLHSTWGKLRSPIVNEYFNFSSGTHSLNVDAGFHPEECYFVRCTGWPSVYEYLDENNDPQAEYGGMVTGYYFFEQTGGSAPGTSYVALGTYYTALSPYYYNDQGVNNRLDLYDREDFFDGMSINSSYTATQDYYYGDNTSASYQTFLTTSINGDTTTTLGPITSLSGMTAF